MAGRSVRVVVLALALIGLLAVPVAGLGPSRSVERAGPEAALEEVVGRLGGSASVGGEATTPQAPLQTLRSVRDHRDVGAWLESVATVVQQRTGSEGVAGTAGGAEPEEEWDWTGSWAMAADAGDLDGDGHDDVLATHYDLSSDDVLLEARRGADGAGLWERASEADGTYAWPAGMDLTGDGRDDVLELTIDVHDESYLIGCDDEDCWEGSYTATFTWAVSVISGADGSAVWTHRYDGDLAETWSVRWSSTELVHSDDWTYSVKGTNLDIVPFVFDNARVGAPDVLVNTLDVDYTERSRGDYADAYLAAAGLSEYKFSVNSHTEADVYDAATGVRVTGHDDGGEGVVALMYPVAQIDGDDLLWERAVMPAQAGRCAHLGTPIVWDAYCTGTEASAATELHLIDGLSQDPLWSAAFDGWGLSWPLGGDLDADGLDDLVVWLFDADWEANSHFVTAADGSTLWSAPLQTVAVGPLDDLPGDDLVTASFAYEWGVPTEPDGPLPPTGDDDTWSYSEIMTLERRNGLTGEVLLSETWTAESSGAGEGDTWTWTYPFAAGGVDGTGDGAPDITVGFITYTWDEDWNYTIGGHDVVAQSGATGETLFAVHEGSIAYPAADFDGDGLTDLAAIALAGQDGLHQVTFGTQRLRDGQRLWSDSLTGHWISYGPAGDLDGDGGADVLRHVDILDGNRLQTHVTALSGTTGTTRSTFASRP